MMKNHFSITEHRDKQFTFYLITSRDEVIHLTSFLPKHEKAIHKLTEEFPDTIISGPVRNDFFSNLIKDLLSNPEQLIEPDFETNPFLASGTEFQKKVWYLMTSIGFGQTMTYSDLATKAGVPKGARAVGNACNANPVALIIPCHRVVAVNGPGGYAGGVEIKKKLIEIERTQYR